MWIVYRINQRLNPREIINTMFDLYVQFPKTHTIGIETVAYQKSLVFFAQEEMRRRGTYLPIRELLTDSRTSKEMRIRALIPRFSNGAVHICKAHTDLIDQLLDFPKGKHDDIIDALAYHLQLLIVPQRRIERVENPFAIETILAELYKRGQTSTIFANQLTDAYVTMKSLEPHLKEANA
jgi:predicted phage terminase large subunit-like protein